MFLEIVSLDVHDNEDFPRYKYLSDSEIRAFLDYFDNLPPTGQIRQCVAKIVTIIDKGNNPPSQDISTYVTKIVSNFDRERIREAVQHTGAYAKKIKDKINAMLTAHAKNNFLAQIIHGKFLPNLHSNFLPQSRLLAFKKHGIIPFTLPKKK